MAATAEALPLDRVAATASTPYGAAAQDQSAPAAQVSTVVTPVSNDASIGAADPGTDFVSKRATQQPQPQSGTVAPQPSSPNGSGTDFVSSHAQDQVKKALPVTDFMSSRANLTDSDFVSKHLNTDTAQAQVNELPAPADSLSSSVAPDPTLTLAPPDPTKLSDQPLRYVDPALDKAKVQMDMHDATDPRVDYPLDDPEGLATPDQIKQIADSYKSPFQLAAQGQISNQTGVAVLDKKSQDWNSASLGQKLQMDGALALHLGADAAGNFLSTVGGEFAPAITALSKGQFTLGNLAAGKLTGPLVGGTAGLIGHTLGMVKADQPVDQQKTEDFIANQTALTSELDSLTDPNGPRGQEIKAQLSQLEKGYQTPATNEPVAAASRELDIVPSTAQQKAQADAEFQRDLKTLASAGQSAGEQIRDFMQAGGQGARDIDAALEASPVMKWLGISQPKTLGSIFNLYGIDTHVPWDQMSQDQKLDYFDKRRMQYEQEGATMLGKSPEVAGLVNFLTGKPALTDLENKAFGTQVSPEEVGVGSLAAMTLATAGLGEVPGADALINQMAKVPVVMARAPIWTVDRILKGASEASKNQTFLGLAGTIPGIINAFNETKLGKIDPWKFGNEIYWGYKAGKGLAKKQWISNTLKVLSLPVKAADRVMATAADEASQGRPFFSGPLLGDLARNWIPDWAKKSIMPDGSMAMAGPVTRTLGGVIGKSAQMGTRAAVLAAGTTPPEEPEKASELVGQMAGLGALGGLPGSLASGAKAPFDHLFSPKYDPLFGGPKESHASYFNYGTDKSLDAHVQNVMSMFPQSLQDKINDLRAFGKGKWEVYPVNSDSFTNIMQKSVNDRLAVIDSQMQQQNATYDAATKAGDSDGAKAAAAKVQELHQQRAGTVGDLTSSTTGRGFYFSNGADNAGIPQAFIRADAVPTALGHEGFGHPVWTIMKNLYAKEAADFLDAAKRTTNMDTFANDYIRRLSNGGIKDASYSNLPDGITPSMIDDELGAEHGAAMLDGANVSTWTKNPTFQRSLVMGVGKVLEDILGIPITSMYSRHEFGGFNASVKAVLSMDQAIRAMSKNPDTIRPWVDAEKPSKPGAMDPRIKMLQRDNPGVSQAEIVANLKVLDDALAKGGGPITAATLKSMIKDHYAMDVIMKAVLGKWDVPEVSGKSPAEIARENLVGRGWTPEEAKGDVADDVTSVREAILNAAQAKVARDKAAAEPQQPAEEEAKSVPFEVEKPSGKKPSPFEGYSPEDLQKYKEAGAGGLKMKQAQAHVVGPGEPGVLPQLPGRPPPLLLRWPGPSGPVSPAPSTPAAPQAPIAGQPAQPIEGFGAPKPPEGEQIPKTEELKPEEELPPYTDEKSVEAQRHMRIKEKVPPGESQHIARRGTPRETKKPKGKAAPPEEAPAEQGRRAGTRTDPASLPEQGGHIGYFGYAGDTTPDHNSLRGIGAFPHSSKAGSMIEGYSAGLKMSEGKRRGILPGEEFKANGHVYRWDDRVPDDSPVGPGYIDVYMPSHPPDRGISADRIAKDQAWMQGINRGEPGPARPGEAIVGQSVVGKGPEAEQKPPLPLLPSEAKAGPEPPKFPEEAPKETPKAETVPQEEENVPRGTIVPQEEKFPVPAGPVTDKSITEAEKEARAAIPEGGKPGSQQANLIREDAIKERMLEVLGRQDANSLAPDDTRVRYDPDSGYISGTHFDLNSPFHRWLLEDQSAETLRKLGAIQGAIAGSEDLYVDYRSATHPTKGRATGAQREAAQEEETAPERAEGKVEGQIAGKNVLPSWVGVTLGKKGKPNVLYYGGVSPDKASANSEMLAERLGPDSPYQPGPKIDQIAEEDLRGYLHNVSNGYKGDGSGPITPVEGSKIPVPKEDFQPYRIPKDRANFWNLAVGGKASGATAEGPASVRARELALKNKGYVSGISPHPPEVKRAIATARAMQIEEAQAKQEAQGIGEEHKYGILKDIQDHGGLPTPKRNNELAKRSEGFGYPKGEVKEVQDMWKAIGKDGKKWLKDNYGITGDKLFTADAKHPDILNSNVAQTSETPFDRPDELLIAARDALAAVRDRHGVSVESYEPQLEEGITNPLQAKIELETPGWSKEHLHSGYERLRIDNTVKIHESGESGAEQIHPSHPQVTKAMQEKGLPAADVVKAGFMPGGELRAPASRLQEERGPVTVGGLTNADRMRKNEHLRAQLEKKQAKLDTTVPEQDKEWDSIAKQIHDLEDEHAKLSDSPEKAATEAKALFMPARKKGTGLQRMRDEPEFGFQDEGFRLKPETTGAGKAIGQEPEQQESLFGEEPVSKKPINPQIEMAAKAPLRARAPQVPDALSHEGEQKALFMPREHIDPSRVTKAFDNDSLHWVATDALDKRWKQSSGSEDLRIPHSGTQNTIGRRYQTAQERLAGNELVNAPRVHINEDGSASFIDGRHTFASMRDAGHDMVPVAMPSDESVQHARDTGLLPERRDIRPEQEYSSAATSINASKVPRVFSKIDWKPGTNNIDVGGGRFDTATQYLANQGATNNIYDPYNRDDEHNASVYNPNHYDTATVSNVLNVIKEESSREGVLKTAYDNLKPGGKVYVGVYEGDKSGVPAPSSKGWQENRNLKDYLGEVRKIFPEATIQNGMIVGTKAEIASERPRAGEQKALFMPGDVVQHPETGEIETVAGKYVRFPNGNVYTHPTMHYEAQQEGIANGEDPNAPLVGGYISSTGRLMNDEEGWALAKASRQLKASAKKVSDMTEAEKAQRRVTGVGRSGLESSDLLDLPKSSEPLQAGSAASKSSSWMPGDTYTNKVGAHVRVTDDEDASPAPGEWLTYAPEKAAYMPFAGERAKGYEKEAKTGRTFITPYDKKPRFEISDDAMRWKRAGSLDDTLPMGSHAPLEDVLHFPELFRRYPDLKTVELYRDPEREVNTGAFAKEAFTGRGNSVQLISMGPTSTAKSKSILTHEIQHWIQNYEGFPGKGSSPELAESRVVNPEEAFDEYQRNAGEVEAREAAKRQGLTPEERKATPPYNPNAIDYTQPSKAWYMPAADIPDDHVTAGKFLKEYGIKLSEDPDKKIHHKALLFGPSYQQGKNENTAESLAHIR